MQPSLAYLVSCHARCESSRWRADVRVPNVLASVGYCFVVTGLVCATVNYRRAHAYHIVRMQKRSTATPPTARKATATAPKKIAHTKGPEPVWPPVKPPVTPEVETPHASDEAPVSAESETPNPAPTPAADEATTEMAAADEATAEIPASDEATAPAPGSAVDEAPAPTPGNGAATTEAAPVQPTQPQPKSTSRMFDLGKEKPAVYKAPAPKPVPVAVPLVRVDSAEKIVPDGEGEAADMAPAAMSAVTKRRQLGRKKGKFMSTKQNNRVSWVVNAQRKTIRGKKNGVQRAKKKMLNQANEASATHTPLDRVIDEEVAMNKLVMYTTSMSAVRATYLNCEKLKQLFYGLRVKVHILDVSMDKQLGNAYFAQDTALPQFLAGSFTFFFDVARLFFPYTIGDGWKTDDLIAFKLLGAGKDLLERLPGSQVPQLFAKGEHLGGYEDVFTLNERGQLKVLLEGFGERPMHDCVECAGSGFVVCRWCGGSGKSQAIAQAFETEASTAKAFLRCTVCNENKLEVRHPSDRLGDQHRCTRLCVFRVTSW